MKLRDPMLATAMCALAIFGVAPAGGAANPRTSPTESGPGYWLMTANGASYAYNAPYLAGIGANSSGNPLDTIQRSDCGNGPGTPIPEVTRCVGISANATGQGYWVGQSSYFSQDGVSQYADSGIPQGYVDGECNGPESAGAYQPTRLVGVAAAPFGAWLVTANGGVFAICGASFFGSMGGTPLDAPIVGMAATPDGHGYWEVGADGGVFAFGDAGYFGSMGGKPLNQPIVGLAASADGKGYWLVASDGGVFAFGDADFSGSVGGSHLIAPMVGIAANPTGAGYWTVAGDGGVFAFGGAPYLGSPTGQILQTSVVGIAVEGLTSAAGRVPRPPGRRAPAAREAGSRITAMPPTATAAIPGRQCGR